MLQAIESYVDSSLKSLSLLSKGSTKSQNNTGLEIKNEDQASLVHLIKEFFDLDTNMVRIKDIILHMTTSIVLASVFLIDK